jgi:hypothetical protein
MTTLVVAPDGVAVFLAVEDVSSKSTSWSLLLFAHLVHRRERFVR